MEICNSWFATLCSRGLLLKNENTANQPDLNEGGQLIFEMVTTITSARERFDLHFIAHVIVWWWWWMYRALLLTEQGPLGNKSNLPLHHPFKIQAKPTVPLPICRLVFSMVEFRLTLESSPRQNLFLLFEGSVKPSTNTLVEEAWKASPTRLFSS